MKTTAKMNIVTIKNEYDRAQKLRAQGDKINAARLFLAVQQWAANASPSRMRAFIFDYAHAAACNVAISILKDDSSSHADRSEAGRIKAASVHLFTRQS